MAPVANPFDIAAIWRRTRPAAIILAMMLAGCAVAEDQRGNLPDPDKLAAIKPGTTTKEQVARILGSPSSVSTFDDNVWYYISRKTKQIAFLPPDVLDQQVYIVNFDDRGVVQDLGHKTIADAEPISPAPGATPSPGRELSFMEQLIGNVGRFGGGSAGAASSTPNPLGH